MNIVIRCRENGPLLIEGPFQVVDHLGNPFPLPTNKPAIALCRCGHSKKKPFCDGSHKTCGFIAGEVAVGGGEAAPPVQRAGEGGPAST